MLVRATQVGYYDHKRRYPVEATHKNAGVPFELNDTKAFSDRWMERVSGTSGKPAARPSPAAPSPLPTGDQSVI